MKKDYCSSVEDHLLFVHIMVVALYTEAVANLQHVMAI